MTNVRPPFFLRWFSPEYLVCDLPGPEKVIYLTFDDGPIPEATPEVLDILGKSGAKATFFMVGDNVRKYPEIFSSVVEGGHAIGNHSYHHLNGWHTSPGAYIHDVYRCRELFETKLFRPPYGRFTPSQYFLLRKDFRFILWSVLTYDFSKNVTPEKCLEYAVNHSQSGSVVVFHDSVKSLENVRYALPRFLEHFLKLGYRFEPLQSAPSSAKL
ncbi:MAG: polysaccharide deacetylase family protein [Bacteroidales bacterium]